MSFNHRTVETPNPAFRALTVDVYEDAFSDASGILPDEGTLYSSSEWKTFFGRHYLQRFSNFRYIGQGGATEKGGTLLFAPALTDAQRLEPFRSISKFGNHRWHPILKKLEIIPDFNTPRAYRGAEGSVSSGPSFYVRQVYIPSVDEGTRFLIEEFFSDIPYTIPAYPTPQPSSVNYDLPGTRGGFPECLHDDITVQSVVTQSQVAGGLGGITLPVVVGSSIPGQFFPATNFKSWAPYVLHDEQVFRMGYHRRRITVFPPRVPRLVVNLAK